MIFNRSDRRRAKLQREVRRAAPEPRAAFLEETAGRLMEARRPERTHRRLRLTAGFALTVLLLALMAAFGGIGYAQTAVVETASTAVTTLKQAVVKKSAQTKRTRPSPTANYTAAAFVYPAPTLECMITFHKTGNVYRLKVSGSTSLDSGTIDIQVTGPGSSFPWNTSVAATSTWTTGNSPTVTLGGSYTATVTQTVSGYAMGSTTCTGTAPTS